MSQNNQQEKAKKDAMQKLRQQRRQRIKEIAATMKAQKKAVKAIKEQLQNGVGTVPRISRETGISADKVLWYLAALKKYGEISEAQKDGGYFQYVLTAGSPKEISSSPSDGSPETA